MKRIGSCWARWLDEDERHREEYADILESLKTGNEAWKDQERGGS